MAMACFLLFTLPPLPPLPERSVPLFFRRMAVSTDLLAPLLYFRRDEDFFFVGMQFLQVLRGKGSSEGCVNVRFCNPVPAFSR
jgi:hypothetical protein